MDVAALGFSIDSSQAASAADNLDKMSAASGRAQSATAKLQSQTDAMGASARAYTAFGKEIQQFLESEAKSLGDVADRRYAYNQALQAGILTQKQYATALQDLAKQEQALGVATQGAANAHGVMVGSMKLTSFQLTEVGRIMKDLATGQTAMLERSSLTLAGSMGILGNAIAFLASGPGAAIGLLVAAIGGAIAIFVSASNELDGYRKSLITTGQTQLETAEQVREAAEQVGASTGQYGAARTAMEALLSTGKFVGDNLKEAAKGVVSFADLTGKSVDQAAKSFEKLLEDPLKASQALDQQFHYLSSSELEQIANLQEMGDKAGAGALAIKDFAEALTSRDQGYRQTLTGWRALWNDISTAIGGAADAAANFMLRQNKPGASNVPWSGGGITSGVVYNNLPPPGLFSDVKSETVALTDAQQKQIDTERAAQQAAQDLAAAMQGADMVAKGYIATTSESTEKMADQTKVLQLAVGGHNAVAKVTVEHEKSLRALAAQYGLNSAAYNSAVAAMKDEYASALNTAKAYDAASAAKKHHTDASKVDLEAQNVLFQANQRMDNILSKLSGDTNAYAKAQAEYQRTITQIVATSLAQAQAEERVLAAQGNISKQAMEARSAMLARAAAQADAAAATGDDAKAVQVWTDALKAAGLPQDQLNKLVENFTQGQEGAHDQLVKTDAQLQYQLETLDGMIPRYQKAINEAAGLTAEQRALAKADADALTAFTALHKKFGDAAPTLEQIRSVLEGMAIDQIKVTEQTKENTAAAREWQSIWERAGNGVVDIFGEVLFEGGSLFGGLADLAKQTVEQIIAYFAKLAIINPILNSIFGGSAGFSLLPELGNAFGGQTALAQTGQAVADAGGYTYAGASGGGGGLFGGITALFSASKWVDYGKSLFNGFSSVMGGSKFVPGTSNFVGPMPEGFTPSWQQYGGYGSALGQGLGIAGGIYAGYNRAQNADGAFGKVGGALAYGAGTYFAGAGVSAALAGGLSAGLAAIPVVGWIALAAMLIDKFSGGNLFGTGWNPTGNTQSNLQIGAEGASFTNQIEEKKKKALFGGNVYKWNDVAATDDQNTYAAQIMAEMDKVRTSAANALGTGVADIVTAAFSEKFDKSGKVLSNISTVLGKTYDEAIDKFIERVQAENVIAQVDVSAGGAASKIAEQYRSDADQLSAAAQFLLAAQTDINKQQALLGDNANLTETAKLVQQLAASNETLIQTYQRLQTETQALKDSLALTGADIGKTGADLVKFADAAATAAGGVQNLQSLMQTFAQAFYSADELARQNIANLKKQVAQSLGALGLDAGISMPDFRKAYEAALPSLTPEQLVQWQQAGVYLAQATAAEKAYNDELAKTAATQAQAQASYDNIVAQLRDGLNQLRDPSTAFEKAISGINAAQISTIDQLNAAAIAAGKSGADAADVALALQYAAEQGVAALRAFEAQTMQLAQSLYGTNVQALQKQLADIQAKQAQAVKDQNYALEAYYSGQQGGLQKQIDEANAQAEALKRLTDATSLLSNLGQIGSITGESLDEISKRFGVPLDKFAADLGLTQSALQQQYTQAELQAQAAIKANDYLANILAVLEGKTPDHNPIPSATGSITGGKVTATTVAAPVISLGTTASPTTVTAPDVATKLDSVATKLDQLLRGIADGTLATQDSARSIVGAITNRSIQPQPVPRTVRTAVL